MTCPFVCFVSCLPRNVEDDMSSPEISGKTSSPQCCALINEIGLTSSKFQEQLASFKALDWFLWLFSYICLVYLTYPPWLGWVTCLMSSPMFSPSSPTCLSYLLMSSPTCLSYLLMSSPSSPNCLSYLLMSSPTCLSYLLMSSPTFLSYLLMSSPSSPMSSPIKSHKISRDFIFRVVPDEISTQNSFNLKSIAVTQLC